MGPVREASRETADEKLLTKKETMRWPQKTGDVTRVEKPLMRNC